MKKEPTVTRRQTQYERTVAKRAETNERYNALPKGGKVVALLVFAAMIAGLFYMFAQVAH